MDEISETSNESSQPSLLNLDWLLISLGVGLLSLLPTFLTLLFKPIRLVPQLSGTLPLSKRRYLGPGQFFVLSVIVFVLVGSLMRRARGERESEVNPSLAETEQFNTGESIGRGMRAFIETTGERLASGDVWSAALVTLPIFLFAVVLGLIMAVFIGGLQTLERIEDQRWDFRHAMGASLYMVGGLTLWNSLFLCIAVLFPTGVPVMIGGLVFLSLFIGALVTLGWQAYSFAKGSGIQNDTRLFFAASLTPFIVVGLLIAWIMMAI